MEKTLRQHPSDCLKIVLFGPESSGKTTLAKALAQIYQTEWVPEYMREYLQEKWDVHRELITKEDLIPIAQGQIERENENASRANSYLFCDTNLRELKVYCEYYYKGFCPEPILEACRNENYDHYFLTQIDVPWEKDDLRDRPDDRSTLFRTFESELITNHLPYTLLEGTLEERIHTASQVLHKLKK
ncbi:MAG: hypothetical protein Aureis2KO_03060 [Aureisphaera sp.]